MPQVVFTDNLKKHLDCPPERVGGETLRAALEAVFEGNDRLRSYIFDDQDRLRKHVTIFINGQMITERLRLDQQIADTDEIYVFQALSGG